MKIHEIINENLQPISPLDKITGSDEANVAYENLNKLLKIIMIGLETLKSLGVRDNNSIGWDNSIKMSDNMIQRFNSRVDEYLNMIKSSENQQSLEIYTRDFEKMKNDLGYIRQMFDESINEDFEPGTPGGNALDSIPTPDPKKKKPPKQELAKRKINGFTKSR